MNDLIDLASGVDIPPTHSVMFEALQDIAEAVDVTSILRTINSLDIVLTSDIVTTDVWYSIQDLGIAFDAVSLTRAWHYDSIDTAAANDWLYSSTIIAVDVTDTAQATDSVDGVAITPVLSAIAEASDIVSSVNITTIDVLTIGTGWDRLTSIQQLDILDVGEAVDELYVHTAFQFDVQDLASALSSIDSIQNNGTDLLDIAQAFSQLSTQIIWQADLIDMAYTFDNIDSTDALLTNPVVIGAQAASNNRAPIPLGIVYQTGMGWTCNTLTFAMSTYTGNLTSPGFSGILCTGRTNFGSIKIKRIHRAYSQHMSSVELALGVQADGRGVIYANTYPVPATESQVGVETQRVKLARGVAGDRWIFELSGDEPFQIESLTVLITEGVIGHG